MSNLSPPPVRETDLTGQAWQKWFASVQALLAPVAAGAGMAWPAVNKSGSSIADLTFRRHSDLQDLNSADAYHLTQSQQFALTSGGPTTLHYHASSYDLTNAVGVLAIAHGGTGATTAATALTALGAYPASNPSGYTANLGTVTSVAALTLGTTGTDVSSTVATGTTTPVIALQIPTASASNRGALSSSDWTTFNGKGSVSSVSGTGTVNGLSLSGTVTTSGSLTLGGTLDLSSPPAIGAVAPSSGKFTTIATAGYTVSTLPTGVIGQRLYVTDALAPVFLTTVAGGGAVFTPVIYNGANWVAG